MNLFEYYKINKINPVPLNLKTNAKLKKHLFLRKNLIENHLRIPLPLLKNKKILEIGPNTGENSLLFAMHGCEITLIEPNKKSLDQLIKNYKRLNLYKNIKKIFPKRFEEINLKSKFDIVIAEGFLNTLKNRNTYLKKITELVDKKGLLLINHDDFYGSFFELLKSNILKMECYKKNFSLIGKDSYRISKKLFYNDYKMMKNTRPFSAYWKDQLASPFAGYVWKYSDILNTLGSLKMYFYSSSPSWFSQSFFLWYKNFKIKKNYFKSINNQVNSFYKDSLDYFLTGLKKTNEIIFPQKKIKELDSLIKELSQNLIKKNFHDVQFSKAYFKNNINKTNGALYNEIFQILDYLNGKKSNLHYEKLRNVRKLTGTNLHYLCFVKSNFK